MYFTFTLWYCSLPPSRNHLEKFSQNFLERKEVHFPSAFLKIYVMLLVPYSIRSAVYEAEKILMARCFHLQRCIMQVLVKHSLPVFFLSFNSPHLCTQNPGCSLLKHWRHISCLLLKRKANMVADVFTLPYTITVHWIFFVWVLYIRHSFAFVIFEGCLNCLVSNRTCEVCYFQMVHLTEPVRFAPVKWYI